MSGRLTLLCFFSFEPERELLSVQVLGTQDFDKLLAESPMEIALTLELPVSRFNCFFWNQSQKWVSIEYFLPAVNVCTMYTDSSSSSSTVKVYTFGQNPHTCTSHTRTHTQAYTNIYIHTHSCSSWSNDGVRLLLGPDPELLNNDTLIVRCASHHMASFALLSKAPEPTYAVILIGKADLSLPGVTVVGLTVSILSLLATVICLITFRWVM